MYACTCTISRVIARNNQYPVDLLTYLDLYLKSSKCLKMGKFGLVSAILSGCGAFKSKKKKRLCERNENTCTLNSFIYILVHVPIVNEISPNKTKNCPRRLTAVEASSVCWKPRVGGSIQRWGYSPPPPPMKQWNVEMTYFTIHIFTLPSKIIQAV